MPPGALLQSGSNQSYGQFVGDEITNVDAGSQHWTAADMNGDGVVTREKQDDFTKYLPCPIIHIGKCI